jgi:hypothetical protein
MPEEFPAVNPCKPSRKVFAVIHDSVSLTLAQLRQADLRSQVRNSRRPMARGRTP